LLNETNLLDGKTRSKETALVVEFRIQGRR